MSAVVVVGAGVSGLSSVVRLLQQGHQVRMLAKDFTPSTTSDISAAMWWPFHAHPAEKVMAWCMASFNEFATLSRDHATGVVMREGVFGFGAEIPPWANKIPGAVLAPNDQLPEGCDNGLLATAPLVEMNRYMPWLTVHAKALGAQMEQRAVTSIEDVCKEADLVVNTTGLGARTLVNDTNLYPVRGRTVRLEQVGVERFIGSEAGEWPLHVFPRANDVVVGGTYEEYVDELDVDPQLDDAIVERAVGAEPLLATAKRIAGVSDLRPARYEVRLEAEVVDGVRVIHNYGHGGGGVTLSWGCADDVATLVSAPSA